MEAAAALVAASLNASKRANDIILKEMEELTKAPEASDTETEPTVSPPTPIAAKRAREEATDEPLAEAKEEAKEEAEEPKAKEAKVDPTTVPLSTVPLFNGQKPKELYVMYKAKFALTDYRYKCSDDDLSFTLNIHPRPTDPLPDYFVVAIYERVLASEPSDWHARVFAHDLFADAYHTKPMGFFGARPYDDWLLGFVRVAGDKRRITPEDEKPLPTTEEVMKLVQE